MVSALQDLCKQGCLRSALMSFSYVFHDENDGLASGIIYSGFDATTDSTIDHQLFDHDKNLDNWDHHADILLPCVLFLIMFGKQCLSSTLYSDRTHRASDQNSAWTRQHSCISPDRCEICDNLTVDEGHQSVSEIFMNSHGHLTTSSPQFHGLLYHQIPCTLPSLA
ncbi:uncharacterized protein LACBIDRAFT_304669 [Laccaria bicolor S238N-H82]|uniref:Predicted protein n=1 Tax=Laccaria bicolor (strain S238N-H82 / ATCC MYA-4686) TaxID=486041 RepID=B0DM43_LACBS|nr:uncharacterized protein LACBIDRAFT_304669 [Laccaria bicolor S238N-H82]EDR04407.1 predicted protein [Laccaria bicolor S238N-H82]|eukprot:XP_001884926.1 predicted protein [Laccaria bicolor S238N-H82]